MGAIILTGFLILVGIAGLLVAALGPRDVKGFGGLITAIVVVVLGVMSFAYVGPTDVGVKIAAGKISSKSVKSGVHFLEPWASVETLPKRPLTTKDVNVKARTAQGGSVTVRSAARWHTDENNASELYLQVRTGDEEKISDTVVDKFLGQAIGNVYAKYQNAEALNNREVAEADLNKSLTAFLKPYGITVDTVYLREVEPDDKTADSVARLTSQQNETGIAKEAVDTATQRGLEKVAAAQGVKNAAAELPTNLTPQQVQLLCIQAWQDVSNQALAKGKDVYTQPCGGDNTTPVTSAK